MSDIAIRVENLSKQYHIGRAQEHHDMLRDALMAGLRAPLRWVDRIRNRELGTGNSTDTIWALRDVSFEVQRGEVLGIIGRNGAGKTTLLKLLSRITEPTEGRAEIHGRVGSLLEVGTGFHPELTGRENIYLNGAILGMRRAEIDRRFDEIVAFAEVERFLDTPVKHYSSGMYVRLAFAVAAHLEPEILLVDEVLAVGDAQFQKKCLGKMGDVARGGRTVLFVSHNMPAVENLCGRGMLLHQGLVTTIGSAQQAIAAYLASQVSAVQAKDGALAENPATGIRLLNLQPLDEMGRPATAVRTGEGLTLRLTIAATRPVSNAVVAVGLDNLYGMRVTVLHSEISGFEMSLAQGVNQVECRVARLSVVSGRYSMHVSVMSGPQVLLAVQGLGPLDIEAGDFYGSGRLPDPAWAGDCYLPQQWKVTST